MAPFSQRHGPDDDTGCVDLDDGVVSNLDVVVSAIAARPRPLKRMPSGPLSDELIAANEEAGFEYIETPDADQAANDIVN